MKEKTKFEEIFYLLQENIIPSIISSLKEMGMRYSHIHIQAQYSLCFFTHLRIDFPFVIEDLVKIKNKEGNENAVVFLNIRADGQLSICRNILIDPSGLSTLVQEVVIFEDFNDMFIGHFRIENVFLFYLASELTNKAKQSQSEMVLLNNLKHLMSTINPKIKREVLIEKSKNILTQLQDGKQRKSKANANELGIERHNIQRRKSKGATNRKRVTKSKGNE
jgi:hypothetical protein